MIENRKDSVITCSGDDTRDGVMGTGLRKKNPARDEKRSVGINRERISIIMDEVIS